MPFHQNAFIPRLAIEDLPSPVLFFPKAFHCSLLTARSNRSEALLFRQLLLSILSEFGGALTPRRPADEKRRSIFKIRNAGGLYSVYVDHPFPDASELFPKPLVMKSHFFPPWCSFPDPR